MKYFSILITVCVTINAFAEPTFKSIFNGVDFSNWVLPKYKKHWQINNGVLIAKSDSNQKGSILWTDKHYKDFIILLDFKMKAGIVDSGIYLRNKDQIQIGISGSLSRDMTCSPCIKGLPNGIKYPKEAD